MNGFYSKNEAATLLKVSPRTIDNYVAAEKLRRIKEGGKIWIPKGDVEALYQRRLDHLPPSRDEFAALEKRLADLEGQMSALTATFGIGTSRDPRTDEDLLMVRQFTLDMLTKTSWTKQEVRSVADIMLTVSEDEIQRLCELRGPTAWSSLFDLSRSMLAQIENDPAYPGEGLETLHGKLTSCQNRLLGLIYVSTHGKTSIPRPLARAIEADRPVQSSLTAYIIHHIARQAQRPA